MEEPKASRVAGGILFGIFAIEGFFIFPPLIAAPHRSLVRLGFLAGPHTSGFLGWILGLVVTIAFVAYACHLPSVRSNLVRASGLKVLAFGVALAAGIFEEYFFRGVLMDWTLHQGWSALLQIGWSGLLFGLAHGIWGFIRGSWRAGLGATLATGALGALLGVVYLAAHRSLAPCVTSHFLINLFAEPGLVLAAVRGEMGTAASKSAPSRQETSVPR